MFPTRSPLQADVSLDDRVPDVSIQCPKRIKEGCPRWNLPFTPQIYVPFLS